MTPIRNRRWRRRVAGATGAIVFAGCLDYAHLNPCIDAPCVDSGDRDGDLGDGHAENGSPDASDADLTATCPGNVVGNAGFETDTVGWLVYNSELTVLPAGSGRTGDGHSVKVCQSSAFTFGIAQRIATPPQGAQYRISGWVRSGTGDNQMMRARAVIAGVPKAASIVIVGTDWQLVTSVLTFGAPQPTEIMFSDDAPDAGTCFLLDDVCVVRIN